MQVGIVTRSFPEMTNQQAAGFMAENGFTVTELCLVQQDSNYWVYNGTSDISDLTEKKVAGIAKIYRDAGVAVHSFGVFTNLIEKEPEKRKHNLDYFVRHLQLAAGADIPVVATECGFDPAHRGVRADLYEEQFTRLLDSLAFLCRQAEELGVILALEPCVLDVVPSAKRMADTISQVGSKHLEVLLDPANLIANSSEKDMFAYLGPDIAYFHGKDRKVNDAYGRNIGEGDIDWPLFIQLLKKEHKAVPFIIEYPRAHNCVEILQRVRAYERQAALL